MLLVAEPGNEPPPWEMLFLAQPHGFILEIRQLRHRERERLPKDPIGVGGRLGGAGLLPLTL